MSDLDTPYDEEELEHFKKLLLQEKAKTEKNIDELQESIHNLQISNDENSAAAHHEADIASKENEREKFLIMLEKEKDKIDEIAAALERIEKGTYGICEETGEKIQKGRLETIPYTRHCM